jgi:hypothetical protein
MYEKMNQPTVFKINISAPRFSAAEVIVEAVFVRIPDMERLPSR